MEIEGWIDLDIVNQALVSWGDSNTHKGREGQDTNTYRGGVGLQYSQEYGCWSYRGLKSWVLVPKQIGTFTYHMVSFREASGQFEQWLFTQTLELLIL